VNHRIRAFDGTAGTDHPPIVRSFHVRTITHPITQLIHFLSLSSESRRHMKIIFKARHWLRFWASSIHLPHTVSIYGHVYLLLIHTDGCFAKGVLTKLW